MILPEQCRAARALLAWKQTELAEISKVGVGTIKNFEKLDQEAEGKPKPNESTLFTLKSAFEKAGIEFTGDMDNPGVIFHKKTS